MTIPEFKTVAGIVLKDADMESGGERVCVQYTHEKECMEYTALLEKEGFQLYTEETICGKDGYNIRFFIYTREDMHIFISWVPQLRVVQIRAAAPSPLPDTKTASFAPSVTPSVTQLKLTLSGICHIVQLCDGSFVLMDGGNFSEADAERLYQFLTDHTPEGKPRIALWLFSHPDIDHIWLATDFIRIYHDRVDFGAFAHRFPDLKREILLHGSKEKLAAQTQDLHDAMHTFCPDAPLYTIHTGQKFHLPGAELDILWTPDMFYPFRYITSNDFSGAWRFTFDSGKTYLYMGDCQMDACMRMASMYGETVKSDIFQVTHHGLIGGDLNFYKLVDPDICLWSTTEARFKGVLEGQVYQWCIGEGGCNYNTWIRDDSIRKREHYHQSETTTILV